MSVVIYVDTLFLNASEAKVMRTTLEELGKLWSLTSIYIDKSVGAYSIDNTIMLQCPQVLNLHHF